MSDSRKAVSEKYASDLDEEYLEPSLVLKMKKIVSELPARRNPKRAVTKRNYTEGKTSLTAKHLYIATLEDDPVPMGTKDRAKKTAPSGIFEVRQSDIHGQGVFAISNVEMGVRLGPYEGHLTKQRTEIGYAWELRNGTYIDARDETISNYLRYVNCARTSYEENLEAYESNGKLFYKTKREILIGEELLVFYGKFFAENLGIDMKTFYVEEDSRAHDPEDASTSGSERPAVNRATKTRRGLQICTGKQPVNHATKTKRASIIERPAVNRATKTRRGLQICIGKQPVNHATKTKRASIIERQPVNRATKTRKGLQICTGKQPVNHSTKTKRASIIERQPVNRATKTRREIQCEHCEYKSIDERRVRRHRMAEHEGDNTKWHHCDLCN